MDMDIDNENWIILESKEISSYPSYPSYIFKVPCVNFNLTILEKIILNYFKGKIIFISYDNYELKISFNELLNYDQEQLLFKIISNYF
jgi:hypothetical protein